MYDTQPKEAIVREFSEEVGLEVKIVPMGDEPVWGEIDDFLEEKPWRCFLHVVKQLS